MITDSEDKNMIAELEKIIRAEEEKPESEQDTNLIDDCIREIAELKGMKANFSDEEVAEITDRLIKETDQEKRKKRFVQIAAGIAAVFMLVGGVTACTINPALISWFSRIVRMPFGSVVEQDKISYIVHGSTEDYKSIKDLLRTNNLDIYYPMILPENITINYVEYVESDPINIICFLFSSDKIKYMVQLQHHGSNHGEKAFSIIETNGFIFDVYQENDHYMSSSEIDGNLYVIQSDNFDDLILIIGGLTKGEK